MQCGCFLTCVLFASCHVGLAFDIPGNKISDTMAAVYTPMKNGGMELDLDRVPAYAAFIAGRNITNVMPAGSNGESLSLSVTERMALAEAWATAGPAAGLRVYMHIGSESVVDAKQLAQHAARTKGISGILCMTPVYFKPTVETLHSFLAEVASGAPDMPFWFYHFPDDTGVLPGGAHKFLELADSSGKIPNLMGIKFTDYNLMDFQLCSQVGSGKYNMLYGRDEQAIAALSLNADAAVTSTVQYSRTLLDAIVAFKKGDRAAALAAQERNAKLCSYFGTYESQGKNVQKTIMKWAGMDVGPSRLPKIDVSDTESGPLEQLLRSKDLIDSPPGGSSTPAVVA